MDDLFSGLMPFGRSHTKAHAVAEGASEKPEVPFLAVFSAEDAEAALTALPTWPAETRGPEGLTPATLLDASDPIIAEFTMPTGPESPFAAPMTTPPQGASVDSPFPDEPPELLLPRQETISPSEGVVTVVVPNDIPPNGVSLSIPDAGADVTASPATSVPRMGALFEQGPFADENPKEMHATTPERTQPEARAADAGPLQRQMAASKVVSVIAEPLRGIAPNASSVRKAPDIVSSSQSPEVRTQTRSFGGVAVPLAEVEALQPHPEQNPIRSYRDQGPARLNPMLNAGAPSSVAVQRSPALLPDVPPQTQSPIVVAPPDPSAANPPAVLFRVPQPTVLFQAPQNVVAQATAFTFEAAPIAASVDMPKGQIPDEMPTPPTLPRASNAPDHARPNLAIQASFAPTSPPRFVWEPAAASAPAYIASNALPNEIQVLSDPVVTLSLSGTPAQASPPSGQPVAMPFQAASHAPSLVAQQIASALQEQARETGQPIELALDPPELGRVRMHMVDIAGVMTLTIHADRPETAELMRRHMNILAQEFAEAGVNAPSVHISQGGAHTGSGGPGNRDETGTRPAKVDAEPETSRISRTLASQGALDLRL